MALVTPVKAEVAGSSPVAPVLSTEVEVRDHVAVTRQLPTGTVTFLFTDIEGSTRLLHDLGPERYAEALEQHRLILRSAFTAHGGVEVDTQGTRSSSRFRPRRARSQRRGMPRKDSPKVRSACARRSTPARRT